MPLKVLADRNIPAAEEAFAAFGDVVTLPAREITAARVRDADLLLCRSTIKVNRELLDGSRVRFVGTATIGIDHLDVPWLESNGIAWASAPGCNADSVQQWFAAALLGIEARLGIDPTKLRVGIVGVGNVGSRVARLCRALAALGGPEPLLNDPPRQAREPGAEPWVSLDELLEQCDLVTLHVPLVRRGPGATVHLVDDAKLARLRPGAIVVNASRGEVLDAEALLAVKAEGRVRAALLDVFPDEPTPSPALVGACLFATAHIAGHSLEGKLNGTQQIYDAACRFAGITPAWTARFPPAAPLTLNTEGRSDGALLLEAVAAGYRLDGDDAALRRIVAGEPPEGRAEAFQRFRQGYPERREFKAIPLNLQPFRQSAADTLARFGVRLC